MAIFRNVGGKDRVVRIIVGVILVSIALLIPIGFKWKMLAVAIAMIAFATALLRSCPINKAFRVNTYIPKRSST